MKKFALSTSVASALALAITHASFAGIAGLNNYNYQITPDLLPLPLPTSVPTGTVQGPSITWVSPSGIVVGSQSGATTAAGAPKLTWVYNSTTGQYSYIGLGLADGDVNFQSYGTTTGSVGSVVPVSASTAVNSAGYVIGTIVRTDVNSITTTDAWLINTSVSNPSSAAFTGANVFTSGATTINVLMPTIINPTTSNIDPSTTATPGITSFYFQTKTGTGINTVNTGSVNSVNSSGQAVGTATRYSGGSVPNTLGSDVYLYGSSGTTFLGLGVSNNATGYYANITASGTTYTSRTNTLIATNTLPVPGVQSLNDSGTVVGMSNRFPIWLSKSATNAGGADAWIYQNGITSQIGLIGTANSTFGTFEGPFTPTISGTPTYVGTRVTTLSELSQTGLVAGTSNVYTNVAGSLSATFKGNIAWIYKTSPSLTPSPATDVQRDGSGNAVFTLAAGQYTQVGLYDVVTGAPSATNMGHAGYTTTSGTNTGSINTISGLSDSGKAVGTATRLTTTVATATNTAGTPTTTYGSSAWYYDGTKTINLEPGNPAITGGTSTYGAGTASYTTGNFGVVSAGGSTVSNYISSTTFNLTQTVTAMDTTGNYVGGSISRYNASGTGNGTDAWFYDATNQQEFVLVGPNSSFGTNGKNSYASINIKSISSTGVVAGTYTLYSSTTSSGAAGIYLYEWSEANGFVTLDQYSTGSAAVSGLNNTLSDQTGWSALNANGPLLLDGNGTLYGQGNTATVATTTNGIFAITVPEPASLTLLAIGGLALLARRKRTI